MYIGSDDNRYELHLLPPYEEDIADGRLEFCYIPRSRQTYRKDCTRCGQKCRKCHKLRKFVISFQYIEIKSWLGCMCMFYVIYRTYCHEMLYYGGTDRIGRDMAHTMNQVT